MLGPRLRCLGRLTRVKVIELWREPEAMFWVFAFPVLLALALGIAFRGGGAPSIPVGLVAGPGQQLAREALDAADGVRLELLDAAEAERRLRIGALDLVVIPGATLTYWSDPTRPESRVAELMVDDVLQRAAGRQQVRDTQRREMTEKGSRYIDFLIPGLLGMNMMGTSMWGIGFYLVNARQNQLLKRMVAAPMRRSDFLLSQIAGRLVYLALEVVFLIGFALLIFDVPLRGSVWVFGVVCVLGALAFCGIGLLVAARPRTLEGVSGLMNLVMLPMWIGSGTFFSTSRFPEAMQPWLQLLPLTAVNDALRAVMLEGAGLAQIGSELAIMVGWGIVSFLSALGLFRWT